MFDQIIHPSFYQCVKAAEKHFQMYKDSESNDTCMISEKLSKIRLLMAGMRKYTYKTIIMWISNFKSHLGLAD